MNLLALMTQQGYIDEPTSIQLAQKILGEKQSEIRVLQNHLQLSSIELATLIAKKTQLPLLNLARIVPSKLPPTMVDNLFLRNLDVIALARRNERLVLAMSNPLDKVTLKKIQERLKLQIDVVVVPHDTLQQYFSSEEEAQKNKNDEKFKQNKNETLKKQVLQQIQKSSINVVYEEQKINANVSNTLKRDQSDIDDTPVVKFLLKILQEAFNAGASDLHFEPFEHNYRIRFRIDGVLHEVSTPPAEIKEKISTRIKVLSKLDIAEKRLPQDGRMKMALEVIKKDASKNEAPKNDAININVQQNTQPRANDMNFSRAGKSIFGDLSSSINPNNLNNINNSNNSNNLLNNNNSNIENINNYSGGNNKERYDKEVIEKKEIDFRVSTLPTLFGEKIVMRILENSSQKLNIDQLGYEDYQKKIILEAINKPYGMVLVTGPTGSGKTVSLYTFLGLLNDGARNISSAEDPAEIQVTGINQVNVNEKAGLTFAAALRSFLRQDPDVIMVGEIRDLETADIAIKAAQTGHLVFSTLHTNDAPSTLVRLMNMGVQSFNIASSVHLITAQRLVRKLCPHCKTSVHYDDVVLNEAGFNQAQIQSLSEGTKIYKAHGCNECNHTGYKGRIGIYQVMPITEALREIILKHGTIMDLENQMRAEGIFSLRQAGILKVLTGATSIEEILANTND